MGEYTFKTEPFEHQRECLRESVRRRYYAYLMEMGTGKTKVAIDEIGILWRHGRLNCVVIIAENSVYRNWSRREIPAHMPDDVLAETDICEYSAYWTQEQRRRIDHICRSNPDRLRIILMPVETFGLSKKAQKILEIFVASGECAVYIDESTKLKTWDSARTERITEACRGAKYRRIMTGLPTPNSPLEAYGQFNFLEPGCLGYSNYWSFRTKYARMIENKRLVAQMRAQGRRVHARNKPMIVVGDQNLDDLAERIAEVSFRKTKAECLDLPPKLWTRRDVELTDEQWAVYNNLRNFFFSEYDGRTITVQMAMHQIMRMQQVVCGFVKDDDGRITMLNSNRLDALSEAVEDIQGKIGIWSCFAEPAIPMIVDRLRESYGERSVAQFWGGLDPEAAEQEQVRWKSDDQCRFIVATQAKGARGNTWTEAHNAIFFAQTADNEARQQAEDRFHRISQTNAVLYTDIVALDTNDERVLRCLRERLTMSSIVSGDGYREWLI